MMPKRSVFIGGGGPSGLAAALLFHQLGWDEIVLAEARTGPGDFEKNRAFNYQIDARGQKLLKRLGINDRMPAIGVENTSFTATKIGPDGKIDVISPPFIDPDRQLAFWSTRRLLLGMLHDVIMERNDGRIIMLYGHSLGGITRTADGAQIHVAAPDGSEKIFAPDLVLACDGLTSALRTSAQALPEVPQGHFAMVEHPSISAELQYKVLNLPAQFPANGGKHQVDNSAMTYIFASSFTDSRRTCTLFSYPVTPGQPRTVNVIREQDHVVWTYTRPEDLMAYLVEAFPQLDIPALISMEEAQDFVDLKPSRFPIPQYSRNLHANLGDMDLLLIGDAAHAFPPDLGLGVNSALEDLHELANCLQGTADHAAGVAAYARARLPQSAALVRLVQTVFPEQYNTRPWAMRKWLARFLVKRALRPVLPWLIDKPDFILTQDPDLDFVEIERRKLKTDRNLARIGAGALALVGLGALALFR